MKTKSLLTLALGLFFSFVKAQVAPVFTGGTTQNISICQNSGINIIDAKMVTSDPDAGQTLTYTIISAPVHGTVHGFPGQISTGAGGIISPTGFDYAPTNGYNGLDSFIVNVSDGSFSAQTKIAVTINTLPTVNAISGVASACLGNSSQLANSTAGGVWSSSNVFVADVSSTGLVTGQAAGNAVISYTVTNGATGCSNVATVNFQVAGQPTVAAITGTTTLCAGSTTQLSSTTSGGVWTSNNTTRATVNSSTGLVTGVSGGAVTITYTVTNEVGCSNFVSTTVTVNNKPNVAAIGATTTTICVASTTTLTNSTIGGTWSSGNTAVATINASGQVTGVATGIATISYTVTNANNCSTVVTVDITVANPPTVGAITGPTNVCVGKTITLSNTTSGGTWSVNLPFRASISSTGVLTGNGAGAVIVTYAVTGVSGCTKSVTYNVNVNSVPNLGAITGSNQICVGTTSTLSNSTSGGTWSNTNTSVATINNGGVVTGVAAGADTIVYIVVNASGCSDTVTYPITVTSAISVANINGGSSVCLGSTLALTNATTGGVWNSSDLSVATVVNGTVFPISQGIVAITYTVGSGACSGVATKNVIVNPSPTVGAISGTTAICVGTTSQLFNATSGGTWTSSNTNIASVSSTGLVTPGTFAGSATITYTVTNTYGCTQSATINVTINNRPNVQQITGINSTCVSSTTQLACTTTGGTWSSSNTSIAIVTSTGLVIGLAPGVDTISYTVTNGNGCSTTVIKQLTVDAALTVAPIVGNATVCIGATPNPTFTCTTTGGTWSSSNTAALTINTNTGVANAVATGNSTITYTVNNGGACTASSTLTVTVANRPAVPTVSGPTSVCVDASITLTGSPTGGKWVSQQTNFLKIDSFSGIATGVASIGFPTNITYTVTNAAGCTRTSNNYAVTVNSGPAIGNITPNTASVCVGANLTLSNTTAGGEWNSSNKNVVIIDSLTGVATGIANGNAVITYIVTNVTGCASSATRFITVNTTPTVATTTGLTSVCVGSSTTLYNGTANGTWSSSNTAIATVSNTGAVTGVSAGTCNITYTVTSGGGPGGGCSASSVTAFTVNAVPTVSAITAPAGVGGVCVGATIQLNNATSGGTWASSNTSRATVSSTGLVTGVSSGSIIISYTVVSGGCSSTAFSNGTVYALPTVAAISGPSSLCVGGNITLTNDSTGGVWSIDNSSVATIDASGLVTGITAGSAIVSYTKTNSNGCVKIVTRTITVNALPVVSPITNNNAVCVGVSNTLSNATLDGVWSSSNTTIASINATSGQLLGLSGGVTTIKYAVTNASGCVDSVLTNVTVYSLPSIAIIGGTNSVCVDNTTTLTNSTTGGTWSSSNANVATITSGGVVTGISAGTTTIKYQVTNTNNCTDSVTTIFTVNSLPTVAAITGNSPVCVASTRNLSSTTTGGVWSSSNTSVATVNSSGVVLGISAGTATITYTVTNVSGCSASVTTSITVNALPTVAALTGTNSVCAGSSTVYASTTIGGVWSSSNTNVATVVGGTITGIAAGTAIISYAVTNIDGCMTTVTKTVTVNAIPTVNNISGANSLCVNASTSLSNSTTGGIWTSSNTAIATVNSATGVVTGVSAGTDTITYTVSNASGCINSTTKIITVNALPATVAPITGTTEVCVGLTTTLATTSTGGVWSSSNVGIATISNLGVVSGVAAGSITITYTITNASGCTSAASTNVSVNGLPIVPAITGSTAVCVNANTTYSNTTIGGVWSSASTSVAIIDANSGVITGLSSGTSVITYTVTNASGCVTQVTKTITVNALPALSIITGNGSVCVNSNTTLFNSQSGGAWSSSNTAVATINAISGVVVGVAAGTSNITYTYTNTNNCTNSVNTTVTVNSLPLVAAITGNSELCVGSTTTYSNSTASGVWFSNNTSVATIDNSGLVTGLTAGTATISYTVVNSNNCVTSVSKIITIKATSTSTTNTSICPSALPFVWNGLTFTSAGSQTAILTNAAGCDSAATLNLTVKANTSSTTNTSICPSALPFVWNGLTFTSAGSQTATLTNAAGCDSAATLNLTVKTNTTSTTNHTACTSYLWNGTTYTTSGTYTFATTNSQGCDSIATLILIINNVSSSTTNTSICPSALPFVWNGLTFTSAGSQTAILTNAAGCDSAATLNLTVKANTSSTTNTSICPSALPFVWNGLTFTSAGSQTATLTNAAGCDSAATLNLTVKANTTSTTNYTACNTYTWNGTTYTTSGVYTFTTTNAVGCDSVATLNLTVNYSSTSTTNHTACNTYTWNGTTYTTSGVYTFTTTNAVGCDSVATLNLTVNYSSTSTTNHAACNTYTWNGTTYTTSGIYTFTTTNAVGCDSVATLNLTVNYSSTSTTNHTACNTYTWNGTTYTTSGVYTFTTTNAVGCDSVATLNLTVNYSSTSTTNHTACNTYTWNGTTYTTSGVYTFTTTNAVGCDSVATLNLTITNSTSSTTNISICANELPYSWNGLTFTNGGSQTAILINAVGCDSAATLNLTVNALPIISFGIQGNHSVCINSTTPLSYVVSGGIWKSLDTTIATISSSGVVTGVKFGSTQIRYIITNANGCSDYDFINFNVDSLPYVEPIVGNNNVCIGSTINLSNATSFGVWSSSNTALATITNGGVVTGISAGNATITYTVTDVFTGCSSATSKTITVDTLPSIATSTGVTAVCVGATTILNNTTLGGVWSSSNNAVATVGASGNVTGVTAGVAIITYTVNNATTGCSNATSTTVTVNGLPTIGSINGSSSICVGGNATLSNTTIGGVWSSSNVAVATIDNSGMISAISAGTTVIKYVVTNASLCVDSVTKAITINDLPNITAIAAAPSVCVGSNITASNITNGGVWSIANTSVATISLSGLITGISAGTTVITYTVTDAATSCSAAISSPLMVNTPAVAPITGVNSLCPLSTSLLSTSTTGGVWSSSDTSVAKVDVSGLVTAISNGTSVITYRVPVGNACGDSASTTVTVNAILSVAPITGDTTVCKGTQSTLASLTLGGVWTSSDTAVAKIDAVTGIVNTIAAGTSVITYTVTSGTGCSNATTSTFTVNALPASSNFTVPASMCVGSTVSLVPTVSGGIWTSNPNSIVSVDNAGNMTGVASGIAMVSYHLVNSFGCSSDTLIKAVIVNSLPVVATISGSNSVCLGATTTLTNDSIGGQWSSNNTSIATINASGVLTAVSAGLVSIDYTLTINGCSATTSKTVTVFGLPTVASITGSNAMCVGSSLTLSSITSGGVWTSLSPAVASVSAIGSVNAISDGVATINYTVIDGATGCIGVANTSITVNALPSLSSITGANNVCLNSSTTLSNTTTGGIWSSSNTSILTVTNSGVVTGVGIGNADITYTVTSLSGCSSSVIKNLIVNTSSTSTTDISICPSALPYSWNGLTFTAAGSQTATLVNALGCDSLATLNLSVKAVSTSTTDISICPSALPYSWNGLTFTAAGSQTATLVNALGCDSLATLNLSVKAVSTSTTDISICPSALPYSWNGLTFTAAGSQTATLVNALGCDSLATLNLSVKAVSTSTTTHTACVIYIWNGTTYTNSGTYTFSTTNSVGCDSIATLILTVDTALAAPVITTSSSSITAGQTGVVYSCATVPGAVSYLWGYTGTGVNIVTGQGTTSVTADFSAIATNGDITVFAVNSNGCGGNNNTVTVTVSPVPVVLSSFSVTKVNNTALLKWTSATEINSKNFEVQRSIDGRTFFTIGTVEAKGYASDYTFTDNKPFAGINYYRLKQVDNNGKFEYSVVKAITFKPELVNMIVNIYPNPTTDILNVRITNGEAKQIRIINVAGKVLNTITTINSNGSMQIPVNHLTAGTYFVEIITSNERKMEKFIKN